MFQAYMSACSELLRLDNLASVPDIQTLVSDVLSSLLSLVELGRAGIEMLSQRPVLAFVPLFPPIFTPTHSSFLQLTRLLFTSHLPRPPSTYRHSACV